MRKLLLPFLGAALCATTLSAPALADHDGGLKAPPGSASCTQDHPDPECCGTSAIPDPDHDGDIHQLCARRTAPIVNRLSNQQTQQQAQVQKQSQTSKNVNVNKNTASSNSTSSATGGAATAYGGAAGNGGSIAAGAVQSAIANYVQVSQPQAIQNAPLASCDSSGALSFGLGVSAAAGGWLQQGTQITGSVSYSTPIGHRARHCDFVAPVVAQPPINVYVTAPAAAIIPAPIVNMVPAQPAPITHTVYLSCVQDSHARTELTYIHAHRRPYVQSLGTSHPDDRMGARVAHVARACGVTGSMINRALDP